MKLPNAELLMEPLSPKDSSRPRSPHALLPSSSRRIRRLDLEKRSNVSKSRFTELDDAVEFGEDQLPRMPEAAPTFLSGAHLRNDAYWIDLLGTDGDTWENCSWINSTAFQTCVGLSIVINSLLFEMVACGDTSHWQLVLKHCCLAFSLFEVFVLAYRMLKGVNFKDEYDRMFLLSDAVVVVVCVLEQWGEPFLFRSFPELEKRYSGTFNTTAQLIWLSRLVRLVRIVPALRELVRGVLQALLGLFWVFILVFVVLYSLAVLATQIIGQRKLALLPAQGDTQNEEIEEVRRLFSSVGNSIFVLFETMSSWSLVSLIPLMEKAPLTRIFFALFYVYSGWTLLAVMTGTVSFTMISMEDNDDFKEEEGMKHVQEVLRDIFEKLDEDGSGSLDHDEFKMILQSPDVLRLLANNTSVNVQDLEDLWTWLDTDGKNEVFVDEFMQGFTWLNEPMKTKTLMKLQNKWTKDIRKVQHRLDSVVVDSFDSMIQQVKLPLGKMAAVTEQVSVLGASLRNFHGELEGLVGHEVDGAHYERQGSLQAIESSLTARMSKLVDRMSNFQPAGAAQLA
eukprot:TRINITY_DN757_c0_g1_i1.p1 TRINITY_DN757_c0_g1~~TRINITY_DN757_c0_g1_i1.p1  ORF type:complete len:564 (-),score=109.18 TRINITY_DN757_c0_g1_i1:21-1712(-)